MKFENNSFDFSTSKPRCFCIETFTMKYCCFSATFKDITMTGKCSCSTCMEAVCSKIFGLRTKNDGFSLKDGQLLPVMNVSDMGSQKAEMQRCEKEIEERSNRRLNSDSFKPDEAVSETRNCCICARLSSFDEPCNETIDLDDGANLSYTNAPKEFDFSRESLTIKQPTKEEINSTRLEGHVEAAANMPGISMCSSSGEDSFRDAASQHEDSFPLSGEFAGDRSVSQRNPICLESELQIHRFCNKNIKSLKQEEHIVPVKRNYGITKPKNRNILPKGMPGLLRIKDLENITATLTAGAAAAKPVESCFCVECETQYACKLSNHSGSYCLCSSSARHDIANMPVSHCPYVSSCYCSYSSIDCCRICCPYCKDNKTRPAYGRMNCHCTGMNPTRSYVGSEDWIRHAQELNIERQLRSFTTSGVGSCMSFVDEQASSGMTAQAVKSEDIVATGIVDGCEESSRIKDASLTWTRCYHDSRGCWPGSNALGSSALSNRHLMQNGLVYPVCMASCEYKSGDCREKQENLGVKLEVKREKLLEDDSSPFHRRKERKAVVDAKSIPNSDFDEMQLVDVVGVDEKCHEEDLWRSKAIDDVGKEREDKLGMIQKNIPQEMQYSLDNEKNEAINFEQSSNDDQTVDTNIRPSNPSSDINSRKCSTENEVQTCNQDGQLGDEYSSNVACPCMKKRKNKEKQVTSQQSKETRAKKRRYLKRLRKLVLDDKMIKQKNKKKRRKSSDSFREVKIRSAIEENDRLKTGFAELTINRYKLRSSTDKAEYESCSRYQLRPRRKRLYADDNGQLTDGRSKAMDEEGLDNSMTGNLETSRNSCYSLSKDACLDGRSKSLRTAVDVVFKRTNSYFNGNQTSRDPSERTTQGTNIEDGLTSSSNEFKMAAEKSIDTGSTLVCIDGGTEEYETEMEDIGAKKDAGKELSGRSLSPQEIITADALLSLGETRPITDDEDARTSQSEATYDILKAARPEITAFLNAEFHRSWQEISRSLDQQRRPPLEVVRQEKLRIFREKVKERYKRKLERNVIEKKAELNLKTECELKIMRGYFRQESWIKIQVCVCGIVGQLFCCGACRSVFYCSKECQIEDKVNHKRLCK